MESQELERTLDQVYQWVARCVSLGYSDKSILIGLIVDGTSKRDAKRVLAECKALIEASGAQRRNQ